MEDYWLNYYGQYRDSSLYFKASDNKEAKNIEKQLKGLIGWDTSVLRKLERSNPGGTDWSKPI